MKTLLFLSGMKVPTAFSVNAGGLRFSGGRGGMTLMFLPKRKQVPQNWINARLVWALTHSGILVAAATVHLWNALFVLFMFLIGSGVWMFDTQSRPEDYVSGRRSTKKLPEAAGGAQKRRRPVCRPKETLF